MTIEFRCSHCQKVLRVSSGFEGRKARCPNCQTVNTVTGTTTNSPAMPTQSASSVNNPTEQLGPSEELFDSTFDSRFDSAVPVNQPSNPYSTPVSAPPRTRGYGGSKEAHRGGLVLGLGIASIVCNICLIPGIMALILGRSDLGKMKKGRMDRSGHGLTLAGTIMGGIATGLVAAILLLYLLLFFIAFMAQVAGA